MNAAEWMLVEAAVRHVARALDVSPALTKGGAR